MYKNALKSSGRWYLVKRVQRFKASFVRAQVDSSRKIIRRNGGDNRDRELMRRSYTWSLAKLHTKSHESGGTDNERGTSLKRYDNAIIQTGRQVAINVTGLRAVIFFIRGSTRVWRMTREEKRKKKKEGGIEKYGLNRGRRALSLFGGWPPRIVEINRAYGHRK